MKALSRQLAHPRGLGGRFVATMLNRANRTAVTRAVAALEPTPGDTLADLGFGGGLGLDSLLDAVGPSGHVVGVDVSRTAIDRAARRHRHQVANDRLALHLASMTQLPLEDDALDGAISVNTIYLIEELDRALAELGRVTKPAGRIVIGLGDPDAMARMPVTRHGFRLRPVAEVLGVAREAGLTFDQHLRAGEGEDAMHQLVLRS
jgi:SAM-dependent methyltransferase